MWDEIKELESSSQVLRDVIRADAVNDAERKKNLYDGSYTVKEVE